MHRALAALPLALALGALAPAADWPTFLGPNRDGTSPETGVLRPWPKAGLKKVWACDLGVGYAPPVVADGKLYHCDRFDDTVRLTARDAATGKFLWKYEYPTTYEDMYGYDPGPRACPVVDGDRVYVYGPEGVLVCVSTAGKEVWKVETRKSHFFHQNFFGVGSVPLVEGELLIAAVGGSERGPRPDDFRAVKPNGTALVAFDKRTGAVKWTGGDDLASYSSPVIATLDGTRTGLYFARGGLLAFDPQTGRTAFRYPWRAKLLESVNASNPVVIGNKVLLTECYGPGAALLEVKAGKPKELWTDRDKESVDRALACHWNTPVHANGFVYGSSGRHTEDADLRCVELATGDLKWRQKRTKRCSLTLIDGHLVSLSEYGDLALVRATPERYDEVSRYEVPELEYPCWAAPVVSNGLLYVRGKGKLLALELVPKK